MDELQNTISSNDPDSMANQAEQAVASGKASERHRLRLRLRYLDPREVDDPTARLEDRARLRETLGRSRDVGPIKRGGSEDIAAHGHRTRQRDVSRSIVDPPRRNA